MKIKFIENIFEKHKKNKHKKKMYYVMSDMKFLLITVAVVLIWRWLWNFTDHYFLNDYYILSNLLSILIWVSIIIVFKLFYDEYEDIKF